MRLPPLPLRRFAALLITIFRRHWRAMRCEQWRDAAIGMYKTAPL